MLNLGVVGTVSTGVVANGALSSSAVCSGTACMSLAGKINAYKQIANNKSNTKY